MMRLRALVCLVALGCSVQSAHAAIAFENHTGSGKVTSASTTGPSFSVTCDGSAGEKLWVALGQQNATTTVTYASASLTEVPTDSPQVNNGYYVRLFYKDSPASGSNTVAVTWGSAIVGNAVAACYSGSGSGLDSHHGSNNGNISAGSITDSTTVVASNCWSIIAVVESTGPNDPTAGTNATRRVAISDANTIGVGLFDSNGIVGTGSQSMTVNSGLGSAFLASVMASFAPSGGSVTCTGYQLNVWRCGL